MSVGITMMSSGRATPRFDRIAESNDRKPILSASASGVSQVMFRSRIGLPYFSSPIWRNGVSFRHWMKLPG
jgi:hypothetical protein